MSDALRTLIEQGQALVRQGDPDGALALFREAVLTGPDEPEGYANLSDLLYVSGFDTEGRSICDIGLARMAGSPMLHWLRCMMALPAAYTCDEEIEAARADFADRLARLRAVCFASPESLAASVQAIGMEGPFFLPYQARNDRDLLAQLGALVADIMGAAFPHRTIAPVRSFRPGTKIRVGIVSGMFWRHSVWRLPTRGWVENLDRSRFELFGYHTRPERDDQTAHAESLFHRFVQGPFPLETWISMILRDAPHVLIFPELGVEQTTLQLAGLRLAPVQCSTWGQPVTTGLPTIDHFLSSDMMEPDGAAAHYTENLVRLPGLGAVYQTGYATWGDAVPDIDAWGTLNVAQGDVRYLCCRAQQKYLPAHDDLFARIALRVPAARFLFIETRRRAATILRHRLQAAFARHGLSMETHCRFVNVLSHTDFTAATRDAHVFLDTPEWSGCNTALEAFLYGVPIVTIPGRFMRGRHAAAILRKADVTGTIARDQDEYVETAVRLGQDAGARAAISAAYHAARPRVFGDTEPVRALETFLTDVVRHAAGAAP